MKTQSEIQELITGAQHDTARLRDYLCEIGKTVAAMEKETFIDRSRLTVGFSGSQAHLQFDAPSSMTVREALEYSIAKWEIVAMMHSVLEAIEGATGVKYYVWQGAGYTCGLCVRSDTGCRDCIVKKTTEAGQCAGTPYTRYNGLDRSDHSKCAKAAMEEVEFLKSLREIV